MMGARSRSQHGAVANRGTCPVCRRANLRLRVVDGRVGFHGKTAASPSGCAGFGEAPLRRGADGVERVQAAGANVIGFRAGVDDAPVVGELPALDAPPELEITVRRYDDGRDAPVRVRSAREIPPDLPPTG